MEMELEITVLVNTGLKEVQEDLKNKGFKLIEKYQLNDIYMINRDVDLSKLTKLEILKKCILVRDIVGIKKELVYKYKNFAENGDILEQGKVKCQILDIEKGKHFMEAINYKELFKIFDESYVYSNDKIEIVVQFVNNKYIFIEFEDNNNTYNSIEELKKALDMYNLPYNKDNYFVKKALIILEETIK
ncbi:MAG: hypothetical protein PHD02_03845 [Bacilli bacterium]|nr:hypothetical protein [Bacilli bacterium]